MSTSENQANAEITARATQMGWQPKEQFKGDPARWVDAATYVERGQQYIPFIKAENRQLEDRTTALARENAELKARLGEQEESINGLKEFHKEQAVAALKAERRQLRSDLVEARKAGDTERELEIEEKLDDLGERERTAAVPAEGTKPNGEGAKPGNGSTLQGDLTKSPEFQQFLTENPWFQTDPVMAAASVALMRSMTESHQLDGMSPAQRFSKVAAATKARFGMGTEAPKDGKVEGGGGTGSGAQHQSGHTYTDLPDDAKAACDRFERRVVGPNKAYKTQAEWRAAYVQGYQW